MGAQRHVAAAEDQAILVKNRSGVDAQVVAAAQGPLIVQVVGVDGQVSGRGQSPQVRQAATAADRSGRGRGDAGHGGQVDLPGAQTQVTDAADPAVAAVTTAQVNRQAAAAGQQAIVDPVSAAPRETLGGQQLAARGLGEVVDVDVEASCLEHAAVGPGIGIEGQAASGDECAASPHEVFGGDIKGAGANMQDTAAGVEKTTGGEGQVGVGGFDDAITVVEQTANLEVGFAAAAQGPQLPGLVIEAGRCYGQGAVAFDDALLVVEGAAEGQVDLAAGDLPSAAVVEVVTGDIDAPGGIQAAVTVVEVGGVQDGITGLRGETPAVVVDSTLCGQLQTLALNNAALIVPQPTGNPRTDGAP
ncbi:hypothetical protein PS880_06206 [Pseudomonas fluorescens]|uniref:Uncharacterized protein n=1 Tax=Pseudomonas fluorescens TaxID=294 RepID=A0A5E7QGD7_PSEFL|nr:hypothetical protein PS880_06206 [Pseudomonas fluorescens]